MDGKIIRSNELKPFVLSGDYSSKVLMDNSIAGARVININEGTLKAGGKNDGETHEKNEIYYVVSGHAVLSLGSERHDIGPGCTIFIPGGTFHGLKNKSDSEDFVLLTFWENAADNGVYQMRMDAWGTSVKSVDEP